MGTGAIILIGLVFSISLAVAAAPGSDAVAASHEAAPQQQPAAAPAVAGAAPSAAGIQASSYYSVSSASPWTPPDPAYRISIPDDAPVNLNRTDGIYRLDYAALASSGLPVDTLDPRTFRMFYMGQEIAIRVNGEGDGRFEPGDEILFYARGVDSLFYAGLLPANKYTGTNIFWLTYGGQPGLRMAQKDGSGGGATPGPYRRTEHLERYTRYVYLNTHPNLPDADHWFDVKLVAPFSRNYTFQAANLAPSAGLTGSLKFNLQGYINTPAPHHIRLSLNGNLVYENNTTWFGGAPLTAQADVPQSYFQEGLNTVTVQLLLDAPTTYDEIYPDWFEPTYYDTHVAENNSLLFDNAAAGTWRYDVSGFTTADAEVYDVTEMLSVAQIVNTTSGGAFTVSFGDTITGSRRYLAATPATYKTPTSIQLVTRRPSAYTPTEPVSRTNRADYIIITHSDFFTDALRLAAYRSQRYAVALLDVQDIYDRFNGGMMSAEAIRDFLAYAYTYWTPPAPRFAVLMGDGTSDMRNYLRTTPATYIPPFLANVDPDLKETAADNLFVTITGADNIPEIALGRMSVNTAAEAAAMVNKVIVYETQCQCGQGGDSWNKNTLFIADNLAHGGGDFYYYSDEIAEGYTDPPSNTIKLLPATYTVTKAYLDLTCIGRDACRNEITQTLNVTGALFVNYVGHAGKDYWSFDAVFSQDLLPALTMTMCLPVYLPMTCYEGSFQDPRRGFSSMAEAYTRMASTGAVASWSPTGSGLVSGHDVLERGLFLAIFHQGYETLGEAVVQAKRYHYTTTAQDHDLLDTMMIFGDPALRMKTESVCNVPTGLPVVQFRGAPWGGKVKLQWETGSEADIRAFNILCYRAGRATETRVVNPSLILAAWAGSNQGERYTFVDESAQAGEEYLYTLEVLKLSGGRLRYGPVAVQAGSASLYLPLIQR